MTIRYEAASITARIQDSGGGNIDPQHKMPDLKDQIRMKEIGGWGMFLINELVDKVEIDSTPGQPTTTTLTINQ